MNIRGCDPDCRGEAAAVRLGPSGTGMNWQRWVSGRDWRLARWSPLRVHVCVQNCMVSAAARSCIVCYRFVVFGREFTLILCWWLRQTFQIAFPAQAGRTAWWFILGFHPHVRHRLSYVRPAFLRYHRKPFGFWKLFGHVYAGRPRPPGCSKSVGLGFKKCLLGCLNFCLWNPFRTWTNQSSNFWNTIAKRHVRLSPQPRAAVVFQAFWFSLLGAQGTGARQVRLVSTQIVPYCMILHVHSGALCILVQDWLFVWQLLCMHVLPSNSIVFTVVPSWTISSSEKYLVLSIQFRKQQCRWCPMSGLKLPRHQNVAV